MGDSGIDQVPPEGDFDGDANLHGSDGSQTRQEWVRANFTRIDPRRYAREHRDQIRQFAQMQRRQGSAVPGGSGAGGDGPANRRYGYGGGGRYGMGFRGGGAWIGILLVLFALRFLLVDSFAGANAAIFWVLGIGGILLVARVFLFSWLRRRRRDRRQ